MFRFRITLLSLFVALSTNALTLPTFAKSLVVTSNSDGDPSKLTLRAAISQALSGDAISFDSSLNGATITLSPSNGSLAINQDLTISAASLPNGITINGNSSSSSIIQIGLGNVTLEGLTLTGAGSGSGTAAVCSKSSGNLTIRNCKIVKNQTTGLVAGFSQTGATVTLSNTTISSNGGNSNQNAGGAVIAADSCSISDCVISNNYGAQLAGGLAFTGSQLSMSGTKVGGNSAFQNGDGGLSLTGLGSNSSMTIDSSSLYENAAVNGASALGVHGPTNVTLSNSDVTSNQSISANGAAIQNTNGTLTLSTCTLSKNQASALVTTSGKTTLTSSTVSDNGAQYVSDAIRNFSGTVTATSSNVENNSGNGFYNQGTATFTSCKFLNNGLVGIFNYDPVGASKFTKCEVKGNGNKSNQNDQTIYPNQSVGVWNQFLNNSSSSVTYQTCGIYQNKGGGVFDSAVGSPGGGSVTLTDCRVAKNFLSGVAQTGNTTLAINDTTIDSNQSLRGAGLALYQVNGVSNVSTVKVSRSTISRNFSTFSGGGIFADVAPFVPGISLVINTSTISNNKSGNAGGGIFFAKTLTSPCKLEIAGSTIADNASGAAMDDDHRRGGGIAISYNPLVTVSLDSSIVARNGMVSVPIREPGDDISGSVVSKGYNLVEVMDGSSGYVSTDQTGDITEPLAPILGVLQNNGGPTETQAIYSTSPEVRKGDPALAGSKDQRGVTRGSPPDVGAYQH